MSLLKPHIPNDDRRFPGRLPSQIPGFGEKPDEWIVDAITDHHGRGIRSEFEIQWKAGDQTWAPYREVAHLITMDREVAHLIAMDREVAHLIAMDRYCDLMGVEEPHDLPARYPGTTSVAKISLCVTGVGEVRGIKWTARDGAYPSAMTPQLTQAEWAECNAYTHQLDEYLNGGSTPPGHPPARYLDYKRMVEHSYPHRSVATFDVPRTLAPREPVSMPTEALSSIIDAQVKMVGLVLGRNDNRNQQPDSGQPNQVVRYRRQYYDRGRRYGGRGSARGHYSRSRPGRPWNKQLIVNGPGSKASNPMEDFPDDVMQMFALQGRDGPGPSTQPSCSVASDIAPGPIGILTGQA